MKHFSLPRRGLLLLSFATLSHFASQAQSVGIGTTGPDASAVLDVVSASKGALLPRLTQGARLAMGTGSLPAPAPGLLLYQTNGSQPGFWYNAGTAAVPAWTFLDPSSAGDNLGNHTATQNLNLQANGLTGAGASISGVGLGVRADGGLNLGQNTTGHSLYLGYQAGAANTTGTNDVFVGTNSGGANTTGQSNLFLGNSSGYANTTGSNNLFLGYVSGLNNTGGGNNQFIGYASGYNNLTGGYNVFDGSACGYSNTTGSYNVFSGPSAGYGNTTGANNVFSGPYAGAANTVGNNNVFSGNYSGYQSASGSDNVLLGANSGFQNAAGSNNTAVGSHADFSVINLTNATAIGYSAVVNASNKIRLGNTSVTVIEGQVPFSNPSDARFKYQVQANVPGLAFITKLRPVTYRFDGAKLDQFTRTGRLPAGFTPDATAPIQSGFLAQEVEQAAKELGYAFDGVHAPATARDHYSMAYAQLVVPLVQAVKELSQQVETLQAQNAALQARAAQADADHASLLTLQAQLARLLGEGAQAQK